MTKNASAYCQQIIPDPTAKYAVDDTTMALPSSFATDKPLVSIDELL